MKKQLPRVEIITKTNKKAYVIFPTYDKQKEYVKEELKFCKQTYRDYCCAFTKLERAKAKEAHEAKRRLFAETKQYAPSGTNPMFWIYKPNMENVRA